MVRKTVDGQIRNKERTKIKLIEAVGAIIRTEGYTGLGVNNIAKHAGVSKKLIYRYFENVENLIEAYVLNKDYWTNLNGKVNQLIELNKDDYGKTLASITLVDLFDKLMNDDETRKIILWEISEKNELMKEVSTLREIMGSKLFALTDPIFKEKDDDIRAIYALLLGGVYYLSLHSHAAGGSFCEINVENDEGKERIKNTIEKVIEWMFSKASETS